MKNLILLIAIILAMSCNKNDDDTALTPKTITPILIAKGDLMGSENIVQQNTVFSNSADWSLIINSIDQSRLSRFTETTTVDFNSFQLIAIFDSVNPSPSYIVSVTKIIENENNIVVNYQKIFRPSFLTVMSQTFHIVKIPKFAKPVIFKLEN